MLSRIPQAAPIILDIILSKEISLISLLFGIKEIDSNDLIEAYKRMAIKVVPKIIAMFFFKWGTT